MRTKTCLPYMLCLVSLSACAEMGSAYQPILDGQPDALYQSDLQSCQDLARSQPLGGDIIGAVIAGGVVGGLVGGDEGDVTSAQGAIAGALFGLIGAMSDGNDQRKSIIVECMRGRGHRVAG